MEDSVDKMVKLQIRVQLYQLLMQQPMKIVHEQSPIAGAPVSMKAVCVICEGERKMQVGEVPTLQNAMDFPHSENCYFGNLVSDMMIATQAPLDA